MIYLSNLTIYNVRVVKEIIMLRIFLLVISVVLFTVGCECEKESGLPVDGDGNVYDTVVIGTQVWLKENLKTTRYRDGTPIPLVTDNDKWASMTTGAYCWYNNNPGYKENYGALYNWYAAGYACPVGWHVPTKEEWETLINYVGNDAGKLKEPRFWSCPSGYVMDCQGNNESGFSARPGSRRAADGTFNYIGHLAVWWSTTSYLLPDGRTTTYYVVSFTSTDLSIYTTYCEKNAGFSVRCIKNSN